MSTQSKMHYKMQLLLEIKLEPYVCLHVHPSNIYILPENLTLIERRENLRFCLPLLGLCQQNLQKLKWQFYLDAVIFFLWRTQNRKGHHGLSLPISFLFSVSLLPHTGRLCCSG